MNNDNNNFDDVSLNNTELDSIFSGDFRKFLYLYNVFEKIINSIKKKDYHNASILIRFYLNDNSWVNFWYKSLDRIIDNQISNLFYDVTYNSNTTLKFFIHLKKDLIWSCKNNDTWII